MTDVFPLLAAQSALSAVLVNGTCFENALRWELKADVAKSVYRMHPKRMFYFDVCPGLSLLSIDT